MKSTEQHPSRAQLVAAAKTSSHRLQRHLQRCAECRELYGLLQRFPLAGSPSLETPAEDAILRWTNVPLLAAPPTGRAEVSGRIVFDSWQERPGAVRDLPEGLVRRLRLAARDLVLEIVGERRRQGWQFIARIYRDRHPVNDFALKAGRKRLLPGEDSFFAWSSAQPPRTVELLSSDERILFEKVVW